MSMIHNLPIDEDHREVCAKPSIQNMRPSVSITEGDRRDLVARHNSQQRRCCAQQLCAAAQQPAAACPISTG